MKPQTGVGRKAEGKCSKSPCQSAGIFTIIFSSIQADYLLQNNFKDIPIYLFLTQRYEKNTHVCRTLFPKTGKDYAKGQPRYTLLKKEKHNMLTGKTVVQYDRLSPTNLKREKN